LSNSRLASLVHPRGEGFTRGKLKDVYMKLPLQVAGNSRLTAYSLNVFSSCMRHRGPPLGVLIRKSTCRVPPASRATKTETQGTPCFQSGVGYWQILQNTKSAPTLKTGWSVVFPFRPLPGQMVSKLAVCGAPPVADNGFGWGVATDRFQNICYRCAFMSGG